MIEVRNLSKLYGAIPALSGITISIRKSEIVGLLGPNGAGKTTAMKLLTGYLIPSGGSASVAGFDVVEQPREAQRRIGYLPENAPLYQDMLVQEYLGFIARMREVPRSIVLNSVRLAIVQCGLTDVQTRPIGQLSKGYRQRVGIAAAIVHDPEILILDEPTNGLDPNQIFEVRSLIRSLGEEKTVIVSTHVLSEVEATCQRAIILINGAIRADGSLDELTQSGSVIVTIEGVSETDARSALARIEGVRSIQVETKSPGALTLCLESQGARDIRRDVWKTAVAHHWNLLELRQGGTTLEQVFRRLTTLPEETRA